jgi:hypothetical protein
MLDKFFPPTDNLYKFIAISGLLFIIISFVPNYLTFRLLEKKIEHVREQDKFLVEITQINDESDKRINKQSQFNRDYDELLENKNKIKNYFQIKTNREKVEQLIEAKKNFDVEGMVFDEKYNALKIKKADLDASSEMNELYKSEISWLESVSFKVFIAGIFLVLVGFYFWYKKMQKPNDLLLLNQTRELLPVKAKPVKRVRPI